ncbi:MAG: hypothetical protein MR270_01550 [Erysipelotrichaceae bacterium]|nr:hypothetical protein [Erysipelotrichaceae bacterium]
MSEYQPIYEKIYNNYLESVYLQILLVVKDKYAALEIIKQVLDRILLIEYQYEITIDFAKRIRKYVSLQIKEYTSTYATKIKNTKLCPLDRIAPKSLYDYNFNAHKIFNEIDNLILINVVVNNIEIKEVAKMLHYNMDLFIERYRSILLQLKKIYSSQIIEKQNNGKSLV